MVWDNGDCNDKHDADNNDEDDEDDEDDCIEDAEDDEDGEDGISDVGRPISGQEGVLKGASPHSYCVRCLLHIALPLHIALHTYGILLPVWCCWTISRGIHDKQEFYSVEYCISLHNAQCTWYITAYIHCILHILAM